MLANTKQLRAIVKSVIPNHKLLNTYTDKLSNGLRRVCWVVKFGAITEQELDSIKFMLWFKNYSNYDSLNYTGRYLRFISDKPPEKNNEDN